MPTGFHNGNRTNRGNIRPVNRRKFTSASYNPRGWTKGACFPLIHVKVETSSAFEDFIAELGVPEKFWAEDPRITRWVHAHKNSRYVPEHLLDALGEKVLWDGVEL